jgi:hypothetical protein
MDVPALAHCSGAGNLAAGWDYCTYPPGSTGPTNATADLVSELSLLLTAGRLPESSKQMIGDAYDERLDETRSTSEALKMAQHLVLADPSFQVTNLVQPTEEVRTTSKPASNQTDARDYKAIVVVFLAGGLDSFNLLVVQCDLAIVRDSIQVRSCATCPSFPARCQEVAPKVRAGVHDRLGRGLDVRRIEAKNAERRVVPRASGAAWGHGVAAHVEHPSGPQPLARAVDRGVWWRKPCRRALARARGSEERLAVIGRQRRPSVRGEGEPAGVVVPCRAEV